MNEPKRLRESGSAGVRELVEAGKRDLPAEHLEATVLGALGLGAAGCAALADGGASAHGLARSTTTRLLQGMKHVVVSKIGIGAIAATTAGSAGYVAGRVHGHALEHAAVPRSAPAARAVAPGPSSNEGAASALNVGPASTQSSVSSALGPVPATRSIPASRETLPPMAAKRGTMSAVASADAPRVKEMEGALASGAEAVAPSMVAQLEVIRRARAFVQEGDGTAALAELDAYEARNPHGTFEEEEMALRVRALRLAGDAAGATRELTNLESRFPRSVHLATLAK